MPVKKRYAELDPEGQAKIRSLVVNCLETLCSSNCIKEIDILKEAIDDYIFDIADSKVDKLIEDIKKGEKKND